MSVLTATLLVLAAANADPPSTGAAPLDRYACAALRALDLGETLDEEARIDDAAMVSPEDGLPAFCRVAGLLAPALRFEVRLPVAQWSGNLRVMNCALPCGDPRQGEAVDAVAQPVADPTVPLTGADLERVARAARALITAYFGAEEIETIITVELAPP